MAVRYPQNCTFSIFEQLFEAIDEVNQRSNRSSKRKSMMRFFSDLIGVVIREMFNQTYLSCDIKYYLMEFSRLTAQLREALEKGVIRYKKKQDRFQPLLVSFEQHQNFQAFVAELYQIQKELDISKDDIKDLLGELGKNEVFVTENEKQFYLLWLESQIMEQLNLTQRLGLRQLTDFPSVRQEQLSFLESIFTAYLPSVTRQEIDQKFLRKIEVNPLFNKYLKSRNPLKGMNEVKKSKLIQANLIKESSTIKGFDRPKFTFLLIKKIVDKIGNQQKIEDPRQTIANLQEYFNELLEKDSADSQILRFTLQQAIFHILNIEIKANCCLYHEKSINVILESFKIFEQFYRCMDNLRGVRKQMSPISDFLKNFQKVVYYNKNAWLWPTVDQNSLIVVLRDICIRDKNHILLLNELLSKYSPNIQSSIWNLQKRQFLFEALQQTPVTVEKGTYLKSLLSIAKRQKLDLQRSLSNGESYLDMFLSLGFPMKLLEDMDSFIDQETNCFMIDDNKTRKRTFIYLTREHCTELMEKFTNPHLELSGVLDNAQYHLKYTLTDKEAIGYYKGTNQNSYSWDSYYEGPLLYSNVIEFADKIKEFQWKILVTRDRTIINLSPEDSDTIGSKIYRTLKNQDDSKTFVCKVAHEKMIIEINAQTLEVKLLTELPSRNNSQIKQNFGYLIYIPAFKGIKPGQINKDEEVLEDNETFIEKDSPLDIKNMATRATTPTLLSQVESEQETEQIFNRSKKVFSFLGVFREFFQIHDKVIFDSKKNVLVSNLDRKSLEYFQKFEKEEIYSLIDKFLLPSIPQKKHILISSSFKLPNKAKIFSDKILNTFTQKFYGKKLQSKYFPNSETIEVLNMKNKEDAQRFFKAFFLYISLLSKQDNQKKNFVLKVNQEQSRYLQESRIPGVQVKGQLNNKVEIECTKQMKEKLQMELQFLDQVKQFILDNSQAFDLMKSMEGNYLAEKNVIEGEKMENFFKISLKLKYYPEFMKKYLYYCQMIAEQPGQNRQRTFPNEADFLHIYRAQFQKEDPSILVSKMLNNIFIEYNSKMEKKIEQVLKRIEELKNKQRDSISQKSSKEFIVKGITTNILFKLKNNLQNMINKKAKNGIQARINLDNIAEDQFIIFGTQVNKEQEEMLPQLIKAFEKSFKAYKRIKYEINDTQKYFNKAFSKLPEKTSQKQMKSYNFDFKVKLRSAILEVVQNATKKFCKELQSQFLAYLDKNQLDVLFDSDLSQKNEKELNEKTENLEIFAKFLNEKIDEAEKESSVKNAALRGIILKETQQIVKTAESAYQAQKLYNSILKRFFKSIKILITIYYGQQLPITAHLQDLRKIFELNDVVMVKVGTGSGKSTVIPPYLIGLGYKKVVVTQPRRLPCREIYKRICQVFGEGVAGYHVGDGSLDEKNSLVYMTDGLIKMKAIYDDSVFDDIDVMVIDEIHERSANIDVLLLLLYSYFLSKKRKLKLILCSATIDTQIGQIMKDANLKVGTFQPQIPSKFKVTQHPISEGTILEKIVQLSKKMKNDEQLLAFFPGVADVVNGVQTLLDKYNVQSYAITSNQPPKEQQKNIQNGRIFISTALAQTSLTFRNLKYVIDSRLSRWRAFDPDFQLMRTDEDYSSNSSIKQRMGRVGRNCDGQYHYYVYQDYDFKGNREHNPTELQKNDFTNYIFEMLLRGDSKFQQVQSLFKKLNHPNKVQFNKKMEYSEEILFNDNILQKNGSLTRNATNCLTYGNLGNPQHNVALYQASQMGCFLNMAYIVTFQMFGVLAMDSILKYCKLQYKSGGDLRGVHDFLVDLGSKIDVTNIEEKEIANKMRIQHKSLMSHSWFNLLIRIMVKVRQLSKRNANNIPAPISQWGDILNIFKNCYSNKVFFNQSLFGGNKKQYEKIHLKESFNYDEVKQDQSKVTFILNKESLISSDSNPPGVIISLYCSISPLGESILSLCEAIDMTTVNLDINLTITGSECDQSYFQDGSTVIDERKIFDEINFDIRNNYNRIALIYNFPEIKMTGSFKDMVNIFTSIIEPKRKNKDLTIQLKKALEEAADNYRSKLDYTMTPVITKEKSMILLQKLTNEDYKDLFYTTTNEFNKNYDVRITWDCKKSTFKVEKAKNIVLSKIIYKLTSFMNWFCQCQVITREEFKIKPQYIGAFKSLKPEAIMNRINSIVDSKIEPYILKGWCNGKGPSTKEARTARMIAVCWILVNKFDCVIKGGFVRDWVVNGEEVLPKTELERKNLLQKNPRNRFLEVVDDTVTPSDIDIEIAPDTPFKLNLFLKEMKKLGISASVQDDGWRMHLMFDHQTTSGGFTADLIQPFTSMTHYTYDFDVNVMYLKKDQLNSIGMKIPLVYEYSDKHIKEEVGLQTLINKCMNKQMTTLKTFIPKYRFEKFELRKWTITFNPKMQPVCYKSLFTQSFPIDPKDIDKICPIFHQKMVQGKNCKIIKIESLKNKGWDDAFEATQHWIINELERDARANNKPTNTINSNNRLLFHGTRTEEAADNIKQSGFDSRYFAVGGMYGRGAYFAEDPVKSHDYTGAPNRKMFIVNVALGKQENLTAPNNAKTGPGVGYHSIYGTGGSAKEYIIDRLGQAKLLYLITYQG